MVNRFCILFLCLAFSYGATIAKWDDIPPTGIAVDTKGNFVYGSENSKDFVLQNQGIFFANPYASLTINAEISGNWKMPQEGICGMIFCGIKKEANGQIVNKYTFNKGNLVFNLRTTDVFVAPVFGFFALNEAELDVNSSFTINLHSQNFENTDLFSLSKQSKLNIEDANLSIFTSSNFIQATDSNITINQGGNKFNQHITIRGNFLLHGASNLKLFLGNKSSYFEGNVALDGASNLELSLFDSKATFWNYRQTNGASATISLDYHSLLEAAIQNGSKTNIILNNQSSWMMWGDSQIGNLVLSSSKVDFMQGHQAPKTLKAQSLSGGGTFALYADVANKQTDSTTFSQASGSHIMQMQYERTTFSQALAQGISEADNMVVATIEEQNSQAVFDGGLTDMGLISYKTNLISRPNGVQTQWLISSIVPSGDSALSRALTTALNTPYRLFDLTSSTFDLRLGDLRNYPKDHGLYARYIVGLGNLKETKNTFETKDVWMSFAGGYDANKVYRNHTDFLGIGFEISLMDSKNSAYTSSTQGYGANLYYTSIFNDHFYYDVIFKYAFSPNSFEFANANNLSGTTSFDAHLITLGFETGKKIGFGKSKNLFYIQPQGKLTSGVILPTNLRVHDIYREQIQGELKMQIPLISRASLYLGYEWNEGFRGDFKLGSFVEYSLNNGGEVRLKDARSQLKKSFKGDLDVGVSAMGSIEVEKFLRVYMQLDSAFLGNYASNIAFNAGVRWSFGDRYIPPPPPPANPDRLNIQYNYDKSRRRIIPTIKEDDVLNMKHHGLRREAFERDYHKLQSPTETPSRQIGNRRNKIRFYPQDRYIPNQSLDTQKGYNRGNKRDTYIPHYQDGVNRNTSRFYKRD